MGIRGEALDSEERSFLKKNKISGVTLFQRNLKTPEQVFSLCKEIQSLSSTPFFIAIDMEGGRVNRLPSPFTKWPSLFEVCQKPQEIVEMTYHHLAEELKSVGINMNFSPCADVLKDPQNELIGDRSIGKDSKEVARKVQWVLESFKKAGLLSCLKHFPGHGNVHVDSHEDLPIEESSLEELLSNHILPFERNKTAPCIMTAHILYKKLSPSPATLSSFFLKDILREKLSYKGLIISDDLGMKALTKNYDTKDIPVLCLNAGCDLLLYCNDFEDQVLALESIKKALQDKKLSEASLNKSLERVLKVKKNLFCAKKFLPSKVDLSKEWVRKTYR